jgi:DNA polymerase IV (DinB-like DNA polymerase)
MAKYIRKVIMNQTGMSASIGVAESRYVAKIASDFKKPAGIIIVTDAKKFLAPLAIGKIPGIGKVSRQYYQQNGVQTIGVLASLDTFKVLDLFGKGGLTFHTVAQGNDKSGLSHREKAKSISRENTFYSSLRDVGLLEQLCNDLCERVYQDLDTMYCKTVSIKVRYSDFQTITRDETLQTPTCSLATIKQAVKNLIRRCIEVGQEIRLIGVKVSNLISFTGQQLLLTDF